MGTASRPKPARLAEKLLHIRLALGLSQNGIARRLGLANKLSQYTISAYERDVREPPLTVLLRYARVAGVWADALMDDELDLPPHLPATPKHGGIPRKRSRS
jgi:transcriptional regulator with XRE-family HTH domain